MTRFEGALAGFRDGVRLISVPRPAFEIPERRWRLAPRWALAGVVAAVLIAIPFYRPGSPAPGEISDSMLFDQANAQLARSRGRVVAGGTIPRWCRGSGLIPTSRRRWTISFRPIGFGWWI